MNLGWLADSDQVSGQSQSSLWEALKLSVGKYEDSRNQKNSCLILGRQKLQLGRSFSCAKQFVSWLEIINRLINWKQFYELIDARILVKLRVLSFVCLFNLSPLLMWKGVSWSGWLQQDLLFSFLRYDFKSDPRSYWNPSRARLLLTVNFSGT